MFFAERAGAKVDGLRVKPVPIKKVGIVGAGLMGGGIGITPMIAFAHRLHALGADFELHYSASRMDGAGYLDDLRRAPWAQPPNIMKYNNMYYNQHMLTITMVQ